MDEFNLLESHEIERICPKPMHGRDLDMRSAICCNQCFEQIARKDTRAAKLWLDLCAFFLKFEGIFKLRETRVPWTIPQFRSLEKMGFITSLDGPDSVSIRVNGYDIVETSDESLCLETFCLDREKHSSSWG